MVDRTLLQCMSCSTGVGCRTQIGHGREQTYLFPCPNCGVDLGYTLFVNQENASWKYDAFVNLENYASDGEPPHLLNFSSDFLVDKGLINSPDPRQFTPQFSNLDIVSDREQYYSLRNLRRRAAEKLWPSLERANTHRIRGNQARFVAELRSIGADKFLDTFHTAPMPQMIAEAFEKFEAVFSLGYETEREKVNERIAEAVRVNNQHVQDLKRFYAVNGRADELFGQLRALDRQWVALYPFFEALEIIDCLKDPDQTLSDRFTLSEKPLELLKAFYSDCFETLGRIFVVAACYDGIASGSGLGVPSRRRVIPPEEFELMANGSKPELISSMSFWPIYDGVFDSKLRNGIGHHSWRYDTTTDTINYQNRSPSRGREEFSVRYLDFCIHTRKLYHCTTVAAKYLHSVWV